MRKILFFVTFLFQALNSISSNYNSKYLNYNLYPDCSERAYTKVSYVLDGIWIHSLDLDSIEKYVPASLYNYSKEICKSPNQIRTADSWVFQNDLDKSNVVYIRSTNVKEGLVYINDSIFYRNYNIPHKINSYTINGYCIEKREDLNILFNIEIKDIAGFCQNSEKGTIDIFLKRKSFRRLKRKYSNCM